MKVLLDNDVVLDFLTARQPFFVEAEEIFNISTMEKLIVMFQPSLPSMFSTSSAKLAEKSLPCNRLKTY
jgi:hypothetical protein